MWRWRVMPSSLHLRLLAALPTDVVKTALRRHVAACADLSEAIRRVNSDIMACTSDSHFVTVCVGIWSLKQKTWTYCAAGRAAFSSTREGPWRTREQDRASACATTCEPA